MGINEFFEKVLGQKLPNQYSWGCYVPSRGAMCLTIWQEEIHRGRVEVHSEVPYRNKAGHINHNWTSRKKDLDLVMNGVPTFGVLISCGKTIDEDNWHILDLNSHQIFALSDLQYEKTTQKWTMAVDLCSPKEVEEIKFDQELAMQRLSHYSSAFKTITKAFSLGWVLIGLNDEVAILSMEKKSLKVSLADGSYTR